MRKARSIWENCLRLIRMRLVIPLLRSPHPPEYKAKGVAVGLAWAMTPLVGIQMWLVFMTWITARKVFKWDFSLPLAIAWTWLTNVFTMIPTYYIFYVTGQIMRWQVDSIGGYTNLSRIIRNTFMSDLDFYDKWVLFFKLLLQDWGVSMALGCLPWAVLFSICGYYMTLRLLRARANRKRRKSMMSKGDDYEASV